MMSGTPDEYASPREAGRTAIEYARDAFIGGLAVVVPFVVTVIVLATIVQYIVTYLGVVAGAAPNQEASPVMMGVAVAVLIAVVFLVGFLTQFRYGETFIEYVDAMLAQVPGFGSIYDSFREMSDVMMESDQQSFRDVKLVEFPHEGAYTLGFLTAESAPSLKDAADEQGLVTLFLPLAPNPVMGGHLVHVPSERVMDVDMTVDEGVRTVVTSGVATGGMRDGAGSSLSADELEALSVGSESAVGARGTAGDSAAARQRRGTDRRQRVDAYEAHAEPDGAHEEPVPSAVADYRVQDTLGDGRERPGDVERSSDDETLGEDEATQSAVAAGGDEGSLGRGFDTPSDVDSTAADGRWRDRTRGDGNAPDGD